MVNAFLCAQSIDRTSYERQRDRLREELTLGQIDHHADATEELDVQGSRIFASWNRLDGWLRQVEAVRRAA